MKKLSICLFILVTIIAFSSCSLPFKIPTEGIWYCESLGISFEADENNPAGFINIKWHLKDGTFQKANAHIGYDRTVAFYYSDENNKEKYIAEGRFKYGQDEFVGEIYKRVTANSLSAEAVEVDNEKHIFRRIDSYEAID